MFARAFLLYIIFMAQSPMVVEVGFSVDRVEFAVLAFFVHICEVLISAKVLEFYALAFFYFLSSIYTALRSEQEGNIMENGTEGDTEGAG